MRTILSMSLVCLLIGNFLMAGCDVAHQQNGTGVNSPGIDSTKIFSIIAFRDTLLKRATERQEAKDLNPSILDDENRFDYLTWEDGSAMYHGRFITDTSDIRTMFFLRNNKVVNVNFRSFTMKPTRLAREALLYYDDNETLIYVEEHSMLLREDQKAGVLMDQPFFASTRPFAEWEQEIQPFKDITFSRINEEMGNAEEY